jgi:hypothetical protein
MSLQELKRAVDVRVFMLDRHRDSLSRVWLQQDLTVESALESVINTADNVLGDLQSGYAVQIQELAENDIQIQAIGRELWELYNQLLGSEEQQVP